VQDVEILHNYFDRSNQGDPAARPMGGALIFRNIDPDPNKSTKRTTVAHNILRGDDKADHAISHVNFSGNPACVFDIDEHDNDTGDSRQWSKGEVGGKEMVVEAKPQSA
jgi:hypothetical protein